MQIKNKVPDVKPSSLWFECGQRAPTDPRHRASHCPQGKTQELYHEKQSDKEMSTGCPKGLRKTAEAQRRGGRTSENGWAEDFHTKCTIAQLLPSRKHAQTRFLFSPYPRTPPPLLLRPGKNTKTNNSVSSIQTENDPNFLRYNTHGKLYPLRQRDIPLYSQDIHMPPSSSQNMHVPPLFPLRTPGPPSSSSQDMRTPPLSSSQDTDRPLPPPNLPWSLEARIRPWMDWQAPG